MMEHIQPGNSILIVWNGTDALALTEFVNELKQSTQNEQIFLENSEHITGTSRPQSSYDVVISNWLPPNTISHSDKLLEVIIRLLKPSGKALFKDKEDMSTKLKLNGYINITKTDHLYVAQKPKFEVGSRMPLKLGSASAVWKLDDTVESAWTDSNNDEIIDPDQLLDDADLKKPEKSSLRVCATTGKRKACADCSCGLAEELRGEGTAAVANETPKSSCGSCYLGDAFRCATCPYLGMPAFKPGEKVLLDLKSDI